MIKCISKSSIWIGAADSLIYQYKVENTKGTQVMGEYDFTSLVTIEPPIEDSQEPFGSP